MFRGLFCTIFKHAERIAMKKENWENQIRWGVTAFVVSAAAVGVVYLIFHISGVVGALKKLLSILAPIIYGAVFAYLMCPIYDRVNRSLQGLFSKKGEPGAHQMFCRGIATLISVVVLIFIAAGLVSMIIPEMVQSITNLANTLPDNLAAFYEETAVKLADYPEAQQLLEQVYSQAEAVVSGFLKDTLFPNMKNIMASLSVGLWSAFVWLKNILIGLIVMAYLLNMKEKLLGQARKLIFAVLPVNWARAVIRECEFVNQMFGGFIVGKVVDSVIIGILTFVVLSFMQMPYTMLVSVIVGVTNVIPFFGPFIGAVPCFVLILLASPIKSLYFAVAILVIQQLDGNVIGPRILGDSTGLSSFWVLFSILLFGGLFGFVGMIIAVPLWAVILNLVSQLVNRELRKKQLPLRSDEYQSMEEM